MSWISGLETVFGASGSLASRQNNSMSAYYGETRNENQSDFYSDNLASKGMGAVESHTYVVPNFGTTIDDTWSFRFQQTGSRFTPWIARHDRNFQINSANWQDGGLGWWIKEADGTPAEYVVFHSNSSSLQDHTCDIQINWPTSQNDETSDLAVIFRDRFNYNHDMYASGVGAIAHNKCTQSVSLKARKNPAP